MLKYLKAFTLSDYCPVWLKKVVLRIVLLVILHKLRRALRDMIKRAEEKSRMQA